MSADGDTALLTVQYDVPVTHNDVYGDAEPLEKAVEPTQEAGIQVVLGGELPSTAGSAMKGTGEIIGVVAALIILLLMFRSVVAAGLPVVVAVGRAGRRQRGHHDPVRRRCRSARSRRPSPRWSGSASASTTRC